MPSLSSYSLAPVPTVVISSVNSGVSSTYTSSVSSSLTSTTLSSTHSLTTSSSLTKSSSDTTFVSVTSTKTTSQSSSSSGSASSASSWAFYQLDGDVIKAYSTSQIDDAPFGTICPGGDCYTSCANYSLLLDKDSYNFEAAATSNISSAAHGVTLFSVCSNVGNVTNAVDTGQMSKAKSFFPTQNAQAIVQDITLNTTMCLADTCQATRDPTQCRLDCDPGALLTSESTMDITQVHACLYRLCSNTCGLPDANQDVFGIGVLISYIIQALLVICCAAAILISTAWHILRDPDKHPEIPESIEQGLGTFITAQCYFGIASVVASFSMEPVEVNPLDGYALLSVAITAFMPPIFTLMLVHSQGKKSRWSMVLVSITWALASVLFFMLLYNLSSVSNSPTRLAEARNSLFKVNTCGGYSAMSLCQENMHNEPLKYLTAFYNQSSLPNIKTVVLLWVWSTLVFLVLLFKQVFPQTNKQIVPFQVRRGRRLSLRQTWASTQHLFESRFVRFVILLVACVVFGLCFGYQAEMVERYFESDVINKNNWAFGQWIAVLFWIPPLVDFVRGPLLDYAKRLLKRNDSDLESTIAPAKVVGTTPLSRRSTRSNTSYQPLAHSPLPSPAPPSPMTPGTNGPFEPSRVRPGPRPIGEDYELRRINRQSTTSLEAGR